MPLYDAAGIATGLILYALLLKLWLRVTGDTLGLERFEAG